VGQIHLSGLRETIIVSTLYIISGPNGAGKTTTALTLFPKMGVTEFVNADLIAYGLSPLNPANQARAAGQIMLSRMDELAKAKQDFAFETTLASRSLLNFIQRCQSQGYSVRLIYIWLRSADLAVERVAKRVASGGHHIPQETICRRYERGRANFFELYQPISEKWAIFDNSGETSQLIARGSKYSRDEILYPIVWNTIKAGKNYD
jgi:predicted ABC-type ATPase